MDAELSVRPNLGDELGVPAPTPWLEPGPSLPGPVLSRAGLEAVSKDLEFEPAPATLDPLGGELEPPCGCTPVKEDGLLFPSRVSGGDRDLAGEDDVLARKMASKSRSKLRLDFFLYFETGGG